jgi:hypothetical protein
VPQSLHLHRLARACAGHGDAEVVLGSEAVDALLRALARPNFGEEETSKPLISTYEPPI